jgi:hypothetical protein
LVRKSWYDSKAGDAVRLVRSQRDAGAPLPLRGGGRGRRRAGLALIGSCLAYPLTDGPGIGLLVLFPPFLWLLSLPVFDVIAIIDPFTKGNWALGLLVLPVFLPLLFSFAMTFGYVLLFLGQMFVASAIGEDDHPRWPEWHPAEISEGLARWLWAALFGVALGGFPVLVYWVHCGPIDWFDRVVFADLVIVGTGYAQMALAAALLHDTLIAANPYTVLLAIVRVGWDYVPPCLVSGVAVILMAGGIWAVLFEMPSFRIAALALWATWVFGLYAAMVALRMLGLTYHAHAHALLWFVGRPKWGTPARFGRIYTNS